MRFAVSPTIKVTFMNSLLRRSLILWIPVLLAFATPGQATTITFASDPFLNSEALTTPGRQIVGGELLTDFDIATDVFAFDPSVFGITTISFANETIANLPSSGPNVIVLQTLDNDANPATPFGAGVAANLIADQLMESGPGFFLYFNSGLNVPRLVYSTDLSDNTADLKVLARLQNLSGQPDALGTFTAGNFQIATVPEPASMATVWISGVMLLGIGCGVRRWRN